MLRETDAFARERDHDDRAGYHVSVTLERTTVPGDRADAALPALLNQFDAWHIVHVTFGSVLSARGAAGRPRFDDRLIDVLRSHAEAHAALEARLLHHLARFATPRVTEAARMAGGNGR
jgi:hypothetical protein